MNAAYCYEFSFLGTVGKCQSSGQIHSQQPIGSGSAQSCKLHSLKLAVWFKRFQAFFNRRGILCRHPKTTDGFSAFIKLQNLINKELSFSIRVAAIDDTIGLSKQRFDGSELGFDASVRFDVEFPHRRENRQILHSPDFPAFLGDRNIIRCVGIRPRLLQKVTKAPSNGVAALAFVKTGSLLYNSQLCANSFGNRGFFRNP